MINVPSDLHLAERVRKAVEIANDEAVRRHHEYVGTAHLLMGLVASEEGVAATVVRNLGLPPKELRKRLEVVIHQGGHFPEGVALERAFTTKARRVFAYAEEEARELGHSYIGTEHMLLGLLNEPASPAAQVLIEAGINEENARQEALRVLGPAPKAGQPAH
jgi:ATP-dependent Clp protease ATP-binding subunit ClpC